MFPSRKNLHLQGEVFCTFCPPKECQIGSGFLQILINRGIAEVGANYADTTLKANPDEGLVNINLKEA